MTLRGKKAPHLDVIYIYNVINSGFWLCELSHYKFLLHDDLPGVHFSLSNLLRPAGVQLQPATFTLKLYRAEDIPRSL